MPKPIEKAKNEICFQRPLAKSRTKPKRDETIKKGKSATTFLRNVQYAIHRFFQLTESAKQRIPQLNYV